MREEKQREWKHGSQRKSKFQGVSNQQHHVLEIGQVKQGQKSETWIWKTVISILTVAYCISTE